MGFNTIVLERGYSEAFFLNKAFQEKNEKWFDFVLSQGTYYKIDVLRDLLKLVIEDSMITPKIIGIDCEGYSIFTKYAINDILYSSKLIEDIYTIPFYDIKDTSKINHQKIIYVDNYEVPKVFYNDSIKYYYDMLNSSDENFSIGIDAMYRDLIKEKEKYLILFGNKYFELLRCISSYKKKNLADCKYLCNETCIYEREDFLYKRFNEFVINDSLRCVGILGFLHASKSVFPKYKEVTGFKSFVCRLSENNIDVASCYTFYPSWLFRGTFLKKIDIGIDKAKYKFLQTFKNKVSFVIYELNHLKGWEKSGNMYDFIIIAPKYF